MLCKHKMALQEWRNRGLQIGGAIGAVRLGQDLGALYRAAKKYKFKSGQTKSRFQSNLGPVGQDMKRKYDSVSGKNKKRKVVQDEGGYTQFKAFKWKSGKKRTWSSKRQSILNTIITRIRLRYSKINDLSQGVGAYFLKHGSDDATYDKLPLFIFNLSNVRQGGEVFAPFRVLRIDKATNSLVWSIESSKSADGTTVQDWQYEDNEGGGVAVGRKSFLDWARIRLTIWGKQNAPGKVTVQLVTLPDEEYCPEYQGNNLPVTKDADFFWKNQVKPLITNPAGGNVSFVHKRMKVHKEWVLNFDPTSTTESDTDPHCKFVDIFRRIGRIIDYSKNENVIESAALFETAGAYLGTDQAFTCLPKYLNKSLYVVIKSMQQDKVDAPSVANTASFDLNVQVCHRTVQPQVLN